MTMASLSPDARINLPSMADDPDYSLATGAQQPRVDLESIIDYRFVDVALQVLCLYH